MDMFSKKFARGLLSGDVMLSLITAILSKGKGSYDVCSCSRPFVTTISLWETTNLKSLGLLIKKKASYITSVVGTKTDKLMCWVIHYGYDHVYLLTCAST